MVNMLYLLMEDPTANRYVQAGAYSRDPRTRTITRIEDPPNVSVPPLLWLPDDVVPEWPAKPIVPRMKAGGGRVYDLIAQLELLPDGLDGVVIWPYNPNIGNVKQGEPADVYVVKAAPFRFTEGARSRLLKLYEIKTS